MGMHVFAPMTLEHIECYRDYSHEYSEPALNYLNENASHKHLLMTTSGLACDLMLCFVLYRWTVYSRSWRFPLALTATYMMRLIVIQMYFMKVPNG